MRLAAAILLAGILTACVNDPAEVLATAGKIEPSVEHGRGVTMLYSEDGSVRMKLEAERVTRHAVDEPYIEFDSGLVVTFYENLRVVSTLKADYGIRYEKTELTEIRDNVAVVNREGEQLNTEELIWDPQEKTIRSDEFVRIRTADEIIFGTGLEADEEFTRYRILNPEGTLKIQDDDAVPEDH